LAALGVRIVVQPHVTLAAAMRAVHDTLIALRRGTAPEKVPGLPDAEFIKRITRQADYDRLLATYMN
jgi:carboxyvinyl-carboxyphosphonate phosphorylmutase